VLTEGDQLHVAWLGDSQALLVSGDQHIQLVTPHKPEDEVRLCRLLACLWQQPEHDIMRYSLCPPSSLSMFYF